MYKTLDPFRTWCKTVLPLVYDDSLSYYELLTIMVNYINDIIKEIKLINPLLNDIINQMEKLKKEVEKAIQELPELVETEVDAYLAHMVETGAFAEILIDDTTTSLIKTWSSDKISDALSSKADTSAIPTKTSDLVNDSGFVTSSAIPTKTSDLTNDSGFITSSDLPTKLSDLTNDEGFIGFTDVTGTLVAGNTSITLSNNAITTNSTIDIYTSDGTEWESFTIATGSITITFEAQSADLGVKVRVS